jgi:glutathione S-transferase
MKLYFSPGTCSLSPHIVLFETGLKADFEKVDIRAKKTADGQDFLSINPKGYVPVLQLDDGSVMTEGPAIVQYLADRAPEKRLAPPAGTMERYRLAEWLNFITAELHKSFGALFNPKMPSEAKTVFRELLAKRIGFAASQLERSTFLMGEQFTVADAYLFTVLNWHRKLEVDLSPWPAVQTYRERVAERQAVRAALEAEGWSGLE